MAKKRNPQDSTLRNVRAAQKRLTAVGRVVSRVMVKQDKASITLGNHEARLRKLESVLFYGGGQLKKKARGK